MQSTAGQLKGLLLLPDKAACTVCCTSCGMEHCSRRSWTVLKHLCSAELLLMTGSAMQMQQRGLGIERYAMQLRPRSGTAPCSLHVDQKS